MEHQGHIECQGEAIHGIGMGTASMHDGIVLYGCWEPLLPACATAKRLDLCG